MFQPNGTRIYKKGEFTSFVRSTKLVNYALHNLLVFRFAENLTLPHDPF